MPPMRRHSQKNDQCTRQGRGFHDRSGSEKQPKTERHFLGSLRRNSLQRGNNRGYKTRSSERHCPHCGRHCSESEFQPEEQALFAKHCSLCFGKDGMGKPLSLLETCLICCRKFLTRTIDAIHSHYSTNHGELLDSNRTIRDIRREWCPEEFPDLNFHHSFGSFLTRKNPILESVDQDVGRYWALLNKSPTMLQHHIHEIGDRYREAFGHFFTAEPISLHGHVSDASSPALLTSLISHLTSRYSSSGSNPFVGKEDKASPCVAILEGSYGAGYGSLAHNSVLEFVRPLANGRNPVVIKTHNATGINGQVAKAKRTGCVALIAEIVRASDGVVISQKAWKHLLRACEKYNLVLVVDEALTAIRCGAPFAYQLPQFQKHGLPDLVLFGKAVKTNGIAVDWRGINMQKLGMTDPEVRLFMALQWQERLTEMAPAASLLTSWGTMVLAEKEQWPKRACEIGQLLRGIIELEGIKSSQIGGLHSLIYLQVQDQARITSPVMGANAGKYVRWFPTMDTVMTSEEELWSKIFGPGSIDHRRDVSAYLTHKGVQLGFCSRCGQAVEAGLRPSCQLCVVGTCEECEPGEHACPMEGKSR